MKTIRIRDETHQRLRNRGTAGHTMDDVISEMLDITESKVKEKRK